MISSAGDAALSVASPFPPWPPGAWSMARSHWRLQPPPWRAGTRCRTTAHRDVGTATDLPNEAVTDRIWQSIGANEALRTGTYSKTLTFTLSTTRP